MEINKIGSVCSGIEAASVAFQDIFPNSFKWFSEIALFPSTVLKSRYPNIPNVGDMGKIPDKILNGSMEDCDLICGGTPCQAFSLSGLRNGLNDDRGNLTLKFVDIINANDKVREAKKKDKAIVFWENVEGVLSDKTFAFGCLIASLAGFDKPIELKKFPPAGIIHGKDRNIAWRVLDAKYFGVPQQRKRLYLLAGGANFFPENILFEEYKEDKPAYPTHSLIIEKDGHKLEAFREYTDCLCAAYGTKWNGNVAAFNGSLFVAQDDRVRRLIPLECERLMGFPDNYTDVEMPSDTSRFKAIGNSWAIPVIQWIGNRLKNYECDGLDIEHLLEDQYILFEDKPCYFFKKGQNKKINFSNIPNECTYADIRNIFETNVADKFYLSPMACKGILRRSDKLNKAMNPRLKELLTKTSLEES
jgi:DNA (cytosine-5)-methyltransferase 1